MRAISTMTIVAALATSAQAFVTAPAQADPAYSANKVLAVFVKERAFAEAFGAEKTRGLGPVARFDLMADFQPDTATLTPAARENLDEFAKAAQDPRLAALRFAIVARARQSPGQAPDANVPQRRADAVVAYLASKGVDPNRLIAKGAAGGASGEERVEARVSR
jgi:outer membrane protein OmpA-like peptidoglycan-associated protein